MLQESPFDSDHVEAGHDVTPATETSGEMSPVGEATGGQMNPEPAGEATSGAMILAGQAIGGVSPTMEASGEMNLVGMANGDVSPATVEATCGDPRTCPMDATREESITTDPMEANRGNEQC